MSSTYCSTSIISHDATRHVPAFVESLVVPSHTFTSSPLLPENLGLGSYAGPSPVKSTVLSFTANFRACSHAYHRSVNACLMACCVFRTYTVIFSANVTSSQDLIDVNEPSYPCPRPRIVHSQPSAVPFPCLMWRFDFALLRIPTIDCGDLPMISGVVLLLSMLVHAHTPPPASPTPSFPVQKNPITRDLDLQPEVSFSSCRVVVLGEDISTSILVAAGLCLVGRRHRGLGCGRGGSWGMGWLRRRRIVFVVGGGD